MNFSRCALTGVLLSAAAACGTATDSPLAADGRMEQAQRLGASEHAHRAADLYRALGRRSGNTVFAPDDIASTLALIHAGAAGDTAAQISQALHRSNDESLESLGTPIETSGSFVLSSSKHVWVQPSPTLNPEFAQRIESQWGAIEHQVDLAGKPEFQRLLINRQVSDDTAGEISELLLPGDITSASRLVIASATAMEGTWEHPFHRAAQRRSWFETPQGWQDAQVLTTTASFAHGRRGPFDVVELPYRDSQVVMRIMMPHSHSSLRGAEARQWVDTMAQPLQTSTVRLSLPAFAFESAFNLRAALSDLGMRYAFNSRRADFSHIDTEQPLFIDNLMHKTLIRVTEAGTTAAAATGVTLGVTAVPDTSIEINRPFVFIVYDRESGRVLFMGHVENPSA